MSNLIWTGSRFQVVNYSKTEQEKLKELGFHYDFKGYCYWTGLIGLALKFSQLPTVKADAKAVERFKREDNQVAMSKAIDSNMEIPVPDGLAYLGFQKAGIVYALNRPDTLIADEMRLGKTVQAIGVINADPSINNILLICPAFLKLNWAREFVTWTVRKLTGGFGSSTDFPNTNIVIINYEIVKKLRKKIDSRKWDLLIMDESHYLKNPDSQRTKAVLGADFHGKINLMPIEAKRRLALTGTPVLNRPIELWPICRIFDPEGLGASHWAFVKKFCFPPEAPILMSNLTEKPISEIKVGDRVIGWERKNYQRRLCEAQVVNVLTKESPLQEVKLNDGTSVVCTPDHEWLCERRDVAEYSIAKTGKFEGRGKNMASRMVRIIDSGLKPQFLHEKEYRLGYLLGFFRGDGWCSKTQRIREYAFREEVFTGLEGHLIGAACNDPEAIYRCDNYLTEFGIDHRETYIRGDGLYEVDCDHAEAYTFFTASQPNSDAWWAGFLGGIYDAEGSYSQICQTRSHNTVTYNMITKALRRFNFKYTEHDEVVTVLGTRDEWIRFWYIASPSLSRKMKAYLFGVPSRTGFGKETRIVESFKGSGGKFMKRVVRPVSITPLPGIHKVYTLTTSTGNYVAYGIGSKNCGAWEAPWGWDFSGHSNLDELQSRLRSKFMVRRTKEEVLPELPPIRRQIIPIPGEAAKKVINAEREFYDKYMAAMDAAVIQAEAAQSEGNITTYKAATEKLREVKQVLFEQMSKLRHDTAVAKVPFVIDYLEDCLQNEKKVVCFAHHRDVIDAIAKHFGEKAVQHHGGLNPIQKQASVDRFKDDPKCVLFVGGLTLAIGYSLASSSLVIMAELSWVPGDMDQAEKRLDAIDQKNSILVQHLCFDQSLDIRMAKEIIKKQSVIKAAVG